MEALNVDVFLPPTCDMEDISPICTGLLIFSVLQ